MKPSRIQDVLTRLMSQRWPAFVWGPPGVGKSAIVKTVAEVAGKNVLDLRASLLDPTDLRGIPAIEDGKAVWCPPSFLPKDSDPAGILFLDEINAAPPLVQASLYQLVLDRRVGEYELPEGWWIVAAGNRQFDRSVVFKLSSALANRFVHLEFEVNAADWREWAIDKRVSPLVTGFIALRPELLLGEPGESPAYPTPRTWEIVSDIIHSFDSIDGCRDLIAGAVGEGPAVEFLAYIDRNVREKDFLHIVDAPDSAALPTSLGDIYALTSWLAYHASDGGIRKSAGILLPRLTPEFGVVLARDMVKASTSFIKESGYKKFIKMHDDLIV